jgi:hypothetical protein
MSAEFDLVHNHHERIVFAAVLAMASQYPKVVGPELLADVACIALNRLPPRYIRHDVDFAFYLSDVERSETQAAIDEAVNSAFAFVQTRAER